MCFIAGLPERNQRARRLVALQQPGHVLNKNEKKKKSTTTTTTTTTNNNNNNNNNDNKY